MYANVSNETNQFLSHIVRRYGARERSMRTGDEWMKIGKSLVVKSSTVFILSEKLADAARSAAVCVCIVYTSSVEKRTLTRATTKDAEWREREIHTVV